MSAFTYPSGERQQLLLLSVVPAACRTRGTQRVLTCSRSDRPTVVGFPARATLPCFAVVVALTITCRVGPTAAQSAEEDGFGPGLKAPGFRNQYYQIRGYVGSRLLEFNQTGSFTKYVEVTWTQAACVDLQRRTWIVDRNHHQVLMMEPETRYISFPAYYMEYAGQRGKPGHKDGSRKEARFDGPSGIAVATSKNSPAVLFVSDSNNHCIRMVEFVNGRFTTIVGFPGAPGLRDGFGLETRFRHPQTMGVDSAGLNLFVVDNIRRIRHVGLGTEPPSVTTLIGGACRGFAQYTAYGSITMRSVACHADWSARDHGETDVEFAVVPLICKGHVATCGPRHLPAIADRNSPNLQPASLEMKAASGPQGQGVLTRLRV
eukprot:TRINITY_DN13336_c0_g1_i1.p1 TRINITY_DN13336_c0_g1~~TRINITY_DN13336_c0_g1_i1.p1  ORF type:complete len:375 (+),score=34.37 TRINITY_DN13336_c0_g1_i1:87-1211(+)